VAGAALALVSIEVAGPRRRSVRTPRASATLILSDNSTEEATRVHCRQAARGQTIGGQAIRGQTMEWAVERGQRTSCSGGPDSS
jgi:hypothetical protein